MNAEQQRNPKSLMKKKSIVVIGAGGMAREVRWLIEDLNAAEARYEFLGYVVTDLSRLGEHDSKADVLGDYSWLEKNKVDCVAIGIGTPVARLKVARELSARFPQMEWPALVHPSVKMDRGSCKVGRGVILCAGTIGTVNLKLEDFCMVNLSCTIGHEATIERGCVLNPTVNISGGVTLKEGVLVGTGAQVLQYLTVGEGATVGAGAVVTKDVPPGVTVVGIPAKELRSKGAM
jgi:sugar O-acyltransferase (sialic acid O-acetyltransferase NeuD family)